MATRFRTATKCARTCYSDLGNSVIGHGSASQGQVRLQQRAAAVGPGAAALPVDQRCIGVPACNEGEEIFS
jgi:hypothetical protein